jgi:purine nucleoside phosphorylase
MFTAAVEIFEKLRFTVPNSLLNIFGRAHSPGPNSIRKLAFLQLSAEVNVKVIIVRVL